MPPEWAALTVEKQLRDVDSTLSLFRRALELHCPRLEFDGDRIEWLPTGRDTLAFRRGGLVCVVNAGQHPVTLPDGQLLLTSGPVAGDKLPPDTAAWLTRE
jgi:alpha-glucosidase